MYTSSPYARNVAARPTTIIYTHTPNSSSEARPEDHASSMHVPTAMSADRPLDVLLGPLSLPDGGTVTAGQAAVIFERTGCKASVRARKHDRKLTVHGPPETVRMALEMAQNCIAYNGAAGGRIQKDRYRAMRTCILPLAAARPAMHATQAQRGGSPRVRFKHAAHAYSHACHASCTRFRNT